MKYYKSIAIILILTGSWFAGIGLYHITSPVPQGQYDNSQVNTSEPTIIYQTQQVVKSQSPPVAPEVIKKPAPPVPVQPPANDVPKSKPVPKQLPQKQSQDNKNQVIGQVVLVHDGDTVNVKIGEDIIKVRLIGVDTPELVLNEFGVTAAAYTRKLIQDQKVKLIYDQERLDKYGRTLAYVYRTKDNLFVNAHLVKEGYARVMTIPPNTAHAAEFKELQREAEKAQRGIWADPPPSCTWRGGKSRVIKEWIF